MTLLPDSIMGNRDLMQGLAEFSEPLVRITDKLVRYEWARKRGVSCRVCLKGGQGIHVAMGSAVV